MHRTLVIFLALAAGLVDQAASAASISPDEIVRRSDDARYPQGDTSVLVAVKDYSKGKLDRETRYQVFSKTGQGETRSVVDTVYPQRLTGRKLLMRGNDLWLYLPSVKRPTRISLREKLTGEVSNGDIARTDYSRDYSAKLLGREKAGNTTLVKLELSARNKDVTYSKILYWVQEGTWRPAKAEFFALSGKLLKTGVFIDYKPVLGVVRSTKMVIRDALQPSKESQLSYSQHKRLPLDESFFSKESLSE